MEFILILATSIFVFAILVSILALTVPKSNMSTNSTKIISYQQVVDTITKNVAKHATTVSTTIDTTSIQPTSPSTVITTTILPVIPKHNYLLQVGLSFSQDNIPAIAYDVIAVKQTDNYGVGPAYLVNGYSTKGYWYQIGLSWNWSVNGSVGHSGGGFKGVYNVFSSSGSVVYPVSGGGGRLIFSGPVNANDTVLLRLYFSNNTVIMSAKDLNTSANASTSYSAYGATSFVGNPYTSATFGFFSGVMVEQYFATRNVTMLPVKFVPVNADYTPAWLWSSLVQYTSSDQKNYSIVFFNGTKHSIYDGAGNTTFESNQTTDIRYLIGGTFIPFTTNKNKP